uniref:Oxidoreductase molybdopterin-binding domain-containing protein n=1 Tax=Plectus sambesii TaxID=2011161 RepID=A0A914V5U6_9BILA
MLGRAMISGLLVGRNGGGPIGRRALSRLQQPHERDDHGRSREGRRATLLAACASGAAAAALGIYVLQQRRIAFADDKVVSERPKRSEELHFLELTDASKHQLRVEVLNGKKQGSVTLNVDELKKKFKPTTITSEVHCESKKPAEMSKEKEDKELSSHDTAISDTNWTGACLRDVLIAAGVDPNDDTIKHIHFEGADLDPSGNHYGASIPFHKAMSPEVLIAYEMNGEPLSKDHGFPLRVVVPGVTGARQVKWLTAIRTSEEESPRHWQ